MTKPLLTGALWEIIQPLLPPEKARPKGVWPQFLDRLALTGILFVARTVTAWELLPPELRMREWQGVLAPPSGLASRRYLAKDLKETIHYLKITTKKTSETIDNLNNQIASLNNKNNVIGVIKDTVVANKIKKVVD